MTDPLKKIIRRLYSLPKSEQNAIAELLIKEIKFNKHFKKSFSQLTFPDNSVGNKSNSSL